MKNNMVIERFLRGMEARGSNLYSTGETLVNYTTTIAKRTSGTVYLSNRKYSNTTTVITNSLRAQIKEFPLLTLKECDHECLN